ncbi:ATP-binding protein [Clostridium saccharobutylicum]|uniref:Uncharacterized protein n=1 Tax=Clostridium saccharobutylicum DSM 13864 TaxID=1345695 RepID=U5MQS1_CLOSA|nr:ATP-binding protein [Clostridium saccharobutylicum]AGX42915.1 hypothetical protein CLSA_c19300 [Clostridium saccharobutylicum DSM 13864]AQR90207.1 chaperone protein HtpG [Clostridium saccharobutylicum]AQS00113.1 chaperone protein HtpG [Clostridium saccharobutylicum]AQS14096.1 chaperone protein HtpG [Clostridium saccharobutylicum]MBA2905473.1 molecular chaperone HtpG [Clostridium saccharobutylicum]
MGKITIGKYTLESLTTGMYVDPYVLYREYIQNAADSIDKAIKTKIINKEDSKITVNILKDKCEIEIIDNGVGISKDKVYHVLMDIGNSEKKSDYNKGFRGIGRLSGLGYCDKIIFETSTTGENIKSSIVFDGVKLQERLSPGKYENLELEDVIVQSSNINFAEEKKEMHYFKVRLINVNQKLRLLDFEKVLEYLQEIAPVPYNIESFEFGKDINQKLNDLSIKIDEYNIFLCSEDVSTKVYKPYRSRLVVDLKKKILDKIEDVYVEVIKNDIKDDKLVALVWYGKSNLLGTITEENLKGLRFRKSGLLIGDRFSANRLFKEDRFNGWVIGEIIILDKGIIPNARRDDFEKNDDYLFLIKKLSLIGEKISNEIRLASKKRNDIQKNSQTDKLNKNITTSMNKLSIINKIDDLISEIELKEDVITKLEKVLKTHKIPDEKINNILKDFKI